MSCINVFSYFVFLFSNLFHLIHNTFIVYTFMYFIKVQTNKHKKTLRNLNFRYMYILSRKITLIYLLCMYVLQHQQQQRQQKNRKQNVRYIGCMAAAVL